MGFEPKLRVIFRPLGHRCPIKTKYAEFKPIEGFSDVNLPSCTFEIIKVATLVYFDERIDALIKTVISMSNCPYPPNVPTCVILMIIG